MSGKLKLFSLFVVLTILFCSAPLSANETKSGDIAEVAGVEVTGSRLADSIADVPSPTYVVTREEIERSGARDVQEALSYVPGVNTLVNAASMAQSKGVSIRGLNTEVLLLVDGIPFMNNNFGVGEQLGSPFDLRSISLTDVERIEVAKGASSAIYGSSAAGGVINVITRGGAEKSSGRVLVEGGNKDWLRGNVRGDLVLSNDLRVSISYTRTQEGDVKMRLANPATGLYDYGTDYKANDYSFRFAKGPWSFVGAVGDYKSKWDYTSTWGAPSTSQDSQKNKYHRFSLNYADGKTTGRVYHNQSDRDVYDSSGVTYYTDKTLGATFNRKTEIGTLPFVFGLDWKRIEGDYANHDNPWGDADAYSTKREGWAPYMETSIPIGEAAFDIGLRYEYWNIDNGADAKELLPRVSFNWANRNGLLYYVTAGRYFSMPSFYQMFGSIPFSLEKNPDLKPEKGWTYDIGLKDDGAKNPWNFGLFYIDMKDKINYSSDPLTWMGKYVNVDEYRGWGFEGKYKWNFHESWSYTQGLSYIHAEQKSSGGEWERADQPRLDLSGVLGFSKDPWKAELMMHYYGDRRISNTNYSDEDIFIVNAAVSWKVERTTLRVACTNIFDKEFFLNNSGYITPERRIVLSASYEF